jgi:hypothetical protein
LNQRKVGLANRSLECGDASPLFHAFHRLGIEGIQSDDASSHSKVRMRTQYEFMLISN